jgi:hypothetical protein
LNKSSFQKSTDKNPAAHMRQQQQPGEWENLIYGVSHNFKCPVFNKKYDACQETKKCDLSTEKRNRNFP